MRHLRPITAAPLPAVEGRITPAEQLILLLLSVFFQDWDNFPQVIQNLQKFYSKTPG